MHIITRVIDTYICIRLLRLEHETSSLSPHPSCNLNQSFFTSLWIPSHQVSFSLTKQIFTDTSLPPYTCSSPHYFTLLLPWTTSVSLSQAKTCPSLSSFCLYSADSSCVRYLNKCCMLSTPHSWNSHLSTHLLSQITATSFSLASSNYNSICPEYLYKRNVSHFLLC